MLVVRSVQSLGGAEYLVRLEHMRLSYPIALIDIKRHKDWGY